MHIEGWDPLQHGPQAEFVKGGTGGVPVEQYIDDYRTTPMQITRSASLLLRKRRRRWRQHGYRRPRGSQWSVSTRSRHAS